MVAHAAVAVVTVATVVVVDETSVTVVAVVAVRDSTSVLVVDVFAVNDTVWSISRVRVDTAVEIAVSTVDTVTVSVDTDAVTVVAVTPAHEQADTCFSHDGQLRHRLGLKERPGV